MKSEYLIFNLIVLAGPLLFGSMKKFRFLERIPAALTISGVVALPYLVWDALATGSHWFFNDRYISGLKLFGLPVEEIMFFFSVPLACLFTWEMIQRFTAADKKMEFMIWVRFGLMLMITVGIELFILGREYTGLMLIFLSLSAIADWRLKTDIMLRRSFLYYVALIALFTLVFNGYLTWRPIVTYGEAYQLGLRIFTIPVEDFGYGFSLLFLVTSFYEKYQHLAARLGRPVLT